MIISIEKNKFQLLMRLINFLILKGNDLGLGEIRVLPMFLFIHVRILSSI